MILLDNKPILISNSLENTISFSDNMYHTPSQVWMNGNDAPKPFSIVPLFILNKEYKKADSEQPAGEDNQLPDYPYYSHKQLVQIITVATTNVPREIELDDNDDPVLDNEGNYVLTPPLGRTDLALVQFFESRSQLNYEYLNHNFNSYYPAFKILKEFNPDFTHPDFLDWRGITESLSTSKVKVIYDIDLEGNSVPLDFPMPPPSDLAWEGKTKAEALQHLLFYYGLKVQERAVQISQDWYTELRLVKRVHIKKHPKMRCSKMLWPLEDKELVNSSADISIRNVTTKLPYFPSPTEVIDIDENTSPNPYLRYYLETNNLPHDFYTDYEWSEINLKAKPGDVKFSIQFESDLTIPEYQRTSVTLSAANSIYIFEGNIHEFSQYGVTLTNLRNSKNQYIDTNVYIPFNYVENDFDVEANYKIPRKAYLKLEGLVPSVELFDYRSYVEADSYYYGADVIENFSYSLLGYTNGAVSFPAISDNLLSYNGAVLGTNPLATGWTSDDMPRNIITVRFTPVVDKQEILDHLLVTNPDESTKDPALVEALVDFWISKLSVDLELRVNPTLRFISISVLNENSPYQDGDYNPIDARIIEPLLSNSSFQFNEDRINPFIYTPSPQAYPSIIPKSSVTIYNLPYFNTFIRSWYDSYLKTFDQSITLNIASP